MPRQLDSRRKVVPLVIAATLIAAAMLLIPSVYGSGSNSLRVSYIIESYTGAINNPPAVLLWSTGAVWANTGDKAVLYESSGKAIDSACYGNACP